MDLALGPFRVLFSLHVLVGKKNIVEKALDFNQ
jgi:hypothetical protein